MAFLDQEFDVKNMPESSGDFEPLPAGTYSARITNVDLKDTKAGNGQYLALRFDITGPTHQGRVVFSNLNIKNPNPKAEEIAHADLGDIMRAIGLAKFKNTDQLVGGDLNIKLTVKNDETYGNKNEVKGYSAIAGSAIPKPAAKPKEEAPSGSQAPWEL